MLAQFEKFEKYKGEDEPKPKARDGLARELDKELEYQTMKQSMKQIKDKALTDQKLGQLSSRHTVKKKKSTMSASEKRSNASRHSRASRGASSTSSKQSKQNISAPKLKPLKMEKNVSMLVNKDAESNLDLQVPGTITKLPTHQDRKKTDLTKVPSTFGSQLEDAMKITEY